MSDRPAPLDAPPPPRPKFDPPRNGPAVVYDETGNVVVRASYVDDVLEGESTILDGPTGAKRETAHYRAGVLEGEMVNFDPQGRPSMRVAYKAGKKHGDMRVYNEGRLITRIAFVAGIEEGPFVSFDDDGNETLHGQNKKGKRDGEWITYVGKGVLKRERYRAGKLHGETTEYWPSGKIREKTMYVDGKKEGESCLFHPNGQLRQKQIFKGGEAKGEPVEYDDKGNQKSPKGKDDGTFKSVLSGILGGKP